MRLRVTATAALLSAAIAKPSSAGGSAGHGDERFHRLLSHLQQKYPRSLLPTTVPATEEELWSLFDQLLFAQGWNAPDPLTPEHRCQLCGRRFGPLPEPFP